MGRLNKECVINISNQFRSVYGTTNRLNPSVIYVEIKGWVDSCATNLEPNLDKRQIVYDLCKNLKKGLYEKIIDSNKFERKFIFDINTSMNPQNKSKKHFLTIDLFVKQIKTSRINELQNSIYEILSDPIKEFERSLNEIGISITAQK